jgi:hypothetical protein
MKKTLITFTIAFVSILMINAQSPKEEIELYQSIIGMEKKAAVAEVITLTGEASTAFWSIYDAYETERKLHGQKRLDLIVKYAKEYMTLDDVKIEEIMKEMISLGNEYNKLIQKYYKSIKKTSGVKTAAQFYQLEIYFQSAVRFTIMDEIPFIGEFD